VRVGFYHMNNMLYEVVSEHGVLFGRTHPNGALWGNELHPENWVPWPAEGDAVLTADNEPAVVAHMEDDRVECAIRLEDQTLRNVGVSSLHPKGWTE
jgi:hypothetical protein